MVKNDRNATVPDVGSGFLSNDVHGVVIGVLVGLGEDYHPLVAFPGNALTVAVKARTTVSLSGEDVGREVALVFEQADSARPIVIGRILKPNTAVARSRSPVFDTEMDGQRLVFAAEKEIVLRCGEASITLTSAGKIIIRGNYLSSRSSGVNLIKGGSVQIN